MADKIKKKVTPEQKTATKIAFNLLFPSLLITGIAIFIGTIPTSIIAICLFFYQASLIKQFIDSNYGTGE